MINRPKAVFFDIDGTLINRSGGPYADDLQAMELAINAGNFLFLNTGRSFANIPAKILDLPLWRGIAAGGGAHILLRESNAGGIFHKTIYHKWIPPKTLMKICSWYLENKRQLVLEGEKECYLIHPSARSFSVRTPVIISGNDEVFKMISTDYITKLTLEGSAAPGELRLLGKYFKINAFPDYAETIIKGENKAKAMKIIIKSLGIRRQDSIALGDSVNDIDMIRYAGLGVAVGNASPLLKAAAKAVTANCGEGGAAQMLRQFVLHQDCRGIKTAPGLNIQRK